MVDIYSEKSNCCGCSACVEVCPKSAIKMQEDEEGFFYPTVDKTKCIECGLCVKSCGFIEQDSIEYPQKYYEAKAKNTEDRLRSRSGGVFFYIAKAVIEAGGIVYGVGTTEGCNVKYLRSECIQDCVTMQGSKYVECSTIGIYKKVAEDLKKSRLVLFSGTACKIAGLKGFLSTIHGWKKENLLTMDIICHGVPSYKVYKSYISFLEKKFDGKVTSFNFRDKSYGWDTHVETFEVNGKMRTLDIYKGLFYSNLFLRPSCGNCKFANYNRPADITIGDFVGSERLDNDFNDNKGLSVVLLNTELGDIWFNRIKEYIYIIELEKDDCLQPNLSKPTCIPKNRNNAWKCYNEKTFVIFLKKYGRYDILHRIKWNINDYPKLKKRRITT